MLFTVRCEMSAEPKTLQEAIIYFADPDNCLAYLVPKRWPKGVTCPTCGSKDVRFMASRRIWQCRTNHPKRQFSVKVGTVFEDSPLGLDKWLPAVWLLTNCKNGVSSCELARDLNVTQKTAWFMLHRIRLAMQDETGGMLGGEVEVDETYIGGKARNMHVSKRRNIITGTGGVGKVAVMGLLQRRGRVRTKVVPNVRKRQLQPIVQEHVLPGSKVFTDALQSYNGLERDYIHQVIDHAEAYAKENVHTNGLENYWSLLKRTVRGTYVSVEPFHLFRYLDEQAFRFNNRQELSDRDRFDLAMSQILGKRLTYSALTGNADQSGTWPN
jgi:transposase-like protein